MRGQLADSLGRELQQPRSHEHLLRQSRDTGKPYGSIIRLIHASYDVKYMLTGVIVSCVAVQQPTRDEDELAPKRATDLAWDVVSPYCTLAKLGLSPFAGMMGSGLASTRHYCLALSSPTVVLAIRYRRGSSDRLTTRRPLVSSSRRR